MGKIECTAVNALIDLAHNRPLDEDEGAELLFAPPPEAKLRRPAAGTAPPRSLFAVELPPPPTPHVPVLGSHPNRFPVEQSIEPTEARATIPKMTYRRPQFEPTPPEAQRAIVTSFVPRYAASSKLPALLKKLAIPAGMLLMIGIGVGAAVSLSRHRDAGKPLDMAAAFTPPKIVIAAPPAPLTAPAPAKPKLVEVRIESSPAGATATLLDRDTGNSMPLGSTPLEASLDPTKSYDVRFELDGRSTTTEHLELAGDNPSPKLAVAFADPEPAPVVAPAPVASDKHHRGKHHGSSVAAKKAASKRVAVATVASAPAASARRSTPSAATNAKQAALASLGPSKDGAGKKTDAPGTLSITTSVPCAILLDGTNTGMTSPAKLSVLAGHHSVRLIAAPQHVNKLFGVDVTAKKTTRLDQTF